MKKKLKDELHAKVFFFFIQFSYTGQILIFILYIIITSVVKTSFSQVLTTRWIEHTER